MKQDIKMKMTELDRKIDDLEKKSAETLLMLKTTYAEAEKESSDNRYFVNLTAAARLKMEKSAKYKWVNKATYTLIPALSVILIFILLYKPAPEISVEKLYSEISINDVDMTVTEIINYSKEESENKIDDLLLNSLSENSDDLKKYIELGQGYENVDDGLAETIYEKLKNKKIL